MEPMLLTTALSSFEPSTSRSLEARPMAWRSSSGLQGLARNWCAALAEFSAVSRSVWPVSTKRIASGRILRTSSNSATPSIFGILMSVTITS